METFDQDQQAASNRLKQEPIKRILHLLRLLGTNACTRQQIFEYLATYYKTDKSSTTVDRSANRMFERDVKLLEAQGFEIQKIKTKGLPTRYSLVKGSGPALPLLFSEPEVELLALLHNLFTDPATSTRHPHTGTLLLPSMPLSHNPYAGEILAFIGKLAATLPPGQIEHFEQRIRRPSVHLNLATAADYLPYRTTIDTIERAILGRQQIRFYYTSVRSKQDAVAHHHVDPYYIIHLDGHFYLIGYSNTLNNFFEYRIDRIKTDSIEILPDMVNTVRQRPTVEFSYWLDGDIARLGISQRWLTQTLEREEVYIDSEGREKRRVLIRAKAHNEWRVIQQLLKYGDQAELVEPAHLREQMRRAVARMQSFYEK
ncbi:MAG TPA: WYL domain-containing protein [Ktedonobacteraceae bacterium]|nr:WYL domain-containing protein [Ktedonobacteraceae bacterium]